jgi:hypothetical protein
MWAETGSSPQLIRPPAGRRKQQITGQADLGHPGTLRAQLTSREARSITIKFPFAPDNLTCDGRELTDSPLGDAYRQLALPAGQSVVVKANK